MDTGGRGNHLHLRQLIFVSDEGKEIPFYSCKSSEPKGTASCDDVLRRFDGNLHSDNEHVGACIENKNTDCHYNSFELKTKETLRTIIIFTRGANNRWNNMAFN